MSWTLTTAYSLLESVGYRPRELYTFARATETWRMNGGTSLLNAIFGRVGLAYDPALIGRDKIERSDESRGASVTVRVARTTAVADALREVHAEPMVLRIERWQDKVANNPVPVVVAYGDIANVRLSGGWVEFDVLTGESIFDAPFPSRLVSRQNQYETFSPFNVVNEDDVSFETTIAAIERSTISVATKAPGTTDGYYDSGMIRRGGIGEHGEPMYVRTSTGLDFQINGRVLSGLAVGDPVTLVAGDDKSLITARDKFGPQAVLKFLGFDLLPTTDVMQTGIDKLQLNAYPYRDAPTTPPGTGADGFPEAFLVNYFNSESPGGATVWVDITDPTNALVRVESRTNSTGFVPDWTAWETRAPETTGGTRYRVDVTKSPVGFAAVEWRISYIDPDDLLEHSETLSLQYTSGISAEETWTEGAGIEPPDQVDFLMPFLSQAEARCYLTMTHDDRMAFGHPAPPFGYALNLLCRLSIDGRAGPFTLHFPTGVAVDGVLNVPSVTIAGLKYFDIRQMGDGTLEWTTVT